MKIKTLKTYMPKSMLPIILLVQFIAIGILALFVYFTLQQLTVFSTGSQIIRTIDYTVRDVNVDAQTGNVYIHEARVVLPPESDANLRLYYIYRSGESNQDKELRLIDGSMLKSSEAFIYNTRSVEQTFKAVPKLQACARGYLVVFTERKDTDIPKLFQKQLKDGRTAYVYLEDLCSGNKETMIPYLKQIESY